MRAGVSRTPSDRRGFALLITITLLAFLVLLLVSLASLTRVETQVAHNTRLHSIAQQNAILSLNLALGRLQKHAGPDDRATARSELTPRGPAHQPFLTGVWERSNTTQTPNAWLVSGDPADPVDLDDVLDPASGGGLYSDSMTSGEKPWVMLVGDASVQTAAQRVRLATRELTAPAGVVPGADGAATIGRYAWWIGDEGVKASAAQVDPLRLQDAISYDSGGTTGDNWTNEVKRARLNQVQPVRPRLERIFPSLSPDTDATARQLAQVHSVAQLGIVANGPTPQERKAAFHSVTRLSEAVFVDHYDATDIRLRRDLSDLNGTFHTLPFSPSGGQRDSIRKYQQFRVTVPDPQNAPFIGTYLPQPAVTLDFPAFHAGPVLTEFGLRCSFEVRDGRIRLLYWVDAEIWNPYAARLVTDATTQLSVELKTGITATVRDDKGSSYSIDITQLLRDANGSTSGTPNGILITAGEEWDAGEVRMVSGGTTLSSTAPVEGDLDTGIGVAADVTRIVSFSLPALTQIEVDLRVNTPRALRIQLQTPHKAFQAVNDAAHPDLSNPAAPRYAFGYGYNLVNNFYKWMQNSGPSGRDVRYQALAEDVFAPTADSSWSGNPLDNINQIPDELFINLGRLVFYDLPRQELVSLGDLRHLAGRKTPELGSSHAGAVNRWLDGYFFSTIPRGHVWNFAGNEPLPSRYVRYLPSDRVTPTITDLRNGDKSARFLLQRGAFNLNSTSVDAWRMMLGQRIVGWRGESTGGGTLDLDNVFMRLTHGAQQLEHPPIAADETLDMTDAKASQTSGRRLTDAQITTLAQGIVNRLRARGSPFPSVYALFTGGNIFSPSLVDTGVLVSGSVTVPTGFGVSQADIAAHLAPVLTPRSDTFLIRAYGDARNPATGATEGRAWCEAVVQRVPDVTDPVSGSYADGDEVKISAAKYPFGRKFKIVSFRWLSPSDI